MRDPDEEYEQYREDQRQQQLERKDWRHADPRFFFDTVTSTFFVGGPDRYFTPDEERRFDASIPGWRRIHEPERFGVLTSLYGPIEPTWTLKQYKKIIAAKRTDWGKL